MQIAGTILIGILFIVIPYAIGQKLASARRRSIHKQLISVVLDPQGNRRIVCVRNVAPIMGRLNRKFSSDWAIESLIPASVTVFSACIGLLIADTLRVFSDPLVYGMIFFCIMAPIEAMIWQREDFIVYLEEAKTCKQEGSVHYRATMANECISPFSFAPFGPLDGVEILTDIGDERLVEINGIYRSLGWSPQRKYSA